MRQFDIYIDGASKGNPGPAGVGVIICDGNEVVKNISSYIGRATNNVAEYTALIFALEEALALGADRININTDSQLLYRQLKKEYRVRSAELLKLYQKVSSLVAAFKAVSLKNIPRQDNCGADKLATQAVKEALKKKKSVKIFEVCSLKS